MNAKEGDHVMMEGAEYVVTSILPSDIFVMRKMGTPVGYQSVAMRSRAELEELMKRGQLSVIKLSEEQKTQEQCIHLWKKYVGAREVYRYCRKCDMKEFINWTEIRDEKLY